LSLCSRAHLRTAASRSAGNRTPVIGVVPVVLGRPRVPRFL
jgi:hypothetical protein